MSIFTSLPSRIGLIHQMMAWRTINLTSGLISGYLDQVAVTTRVGLLHQLSFPIKTGLRAPKAPYQGHFMHFYLTIILGPAPGDQADRK